MIKLNADDYNILKMIENNIDATNQIQKKLTLNGYRKNRLWYHRKFILLKERGMVGLCKWGSTNKVYLTRIGEEYIKFYENIEGFK